MTIEDLHKNKAVLIKEFPVVENEIFLANAAVCPLPSRVAEAMSNYALSATKGDQELRFPLTLLGETRQLAAELLNTDADNIALVGPTSIALSIVANGVNFKKGDNVIYAPGDYPSNAVVWMNLAKRGIDLRPIEPKVPGRITVDDLKLLVDEKTKLVSLASVHFISGYRIDLDTIGEYLQNRNVLFCVDAIQSVGALQTSVKYVDFLAADAHKWMLGPCSAGILFVSTKAREILEPTLVGWNNVLCPNFVTPDSIKFKTHANRYEAGSHNLVGIIGLNASLKLIREFKLINIENYILDLSKFIRDNIKIKGYLLANDDDNNYSGITSVRKDDFDIEALYDKLKDIKMTLSCRQTRDRRYWLRFSPHLYNSKEEIKKVLEVI